MSIDRTVCQDLIQTLEDGKEGFLKAAERLSGSDRPELAAKFRDYSAQREGFAKELKGLAVQYGDTVAETGTVAGTLHRGWMAMKDILAGSDPGGVLDAAEQGEDHAVAEYERALAEQNLSGDLRSVLQRQYVTVKATHDDVRALRDAHA